MRRYEAMPNLKKAELIAGVVYVPAPVRFDYHAEPQMTIGCWLGTYLAKTPGVRAGDNATVMLDAASVAQPGSLLFIRPESGGRVRIADGYIEGAPDLVAEVAATSASYDLHDKLHAYEQNGVREYIVWRVFDQQVDWFVLEEHHYQRLTPDQDGILRSRVFPGLWLDPAALVRGDAETVLAVLDRGLSSPEHAAFVTRLRESAAMPAS